MQRVNLVYGEVLFPCVGGERELFPFSLSALPPWCRKLSLNGSLSARYGKMYLTRGEGRGGGGEYMPSKDIEKLTSHTVSVLLKREREGER